MYGKIAIDLSELNSLTDGPIVVNSSDLPDPIILIRDGENFRALSARCTHLDCIVRPSKNFLQCPCHGSAFDLNGKVVRGPAQRPLKTYPISISENQIEITIF